MYHTGTNSMSARKLCALLCEETGKMTSKGGVSLGTFTMSAQEEREWEKRDELGSGSNCVRAPIVWASGVSGCFKDMTAPLLAVIFCPSLLGGAIRKCWSAQCSAKTNFSAVADCSLTTGLGWKYWWIFSVLLHFLVATEQLLTCLVQLVILKTVS